MLPDALENLARLLSRLPGVGEKTAQRLALYLATADDGLARDLGVALTELRQRVRQCETCGNLATPDADGTAICSLCTDSQRTASELCVVGKIQDLLAIERSGAFRGRYFVLGALLSPLDGIGPEELPLSQLVRRVKAEQVREVIVATPPSVDGEATALLLARELIPLGVRVSRIASGIRWFIGMMMRTRRTWPTPRRRRCPACPW